MSLFNSVPIVDTFVRPKNFVIPFFATNLTENCRFLFDNLILLLHGVAELIEAKSREVARSISNVEFDIVH